MIPTTSQEVFDGFCTSLADSLGIDEEEIALANTLGPDLGAESIDILDTTFRVEKLFETRLKKFPESLVSDGKLRNPDYLLGEEGVATWREWFPFDNRDINSESSAAELFTVEVWCQHLCNVLRIEWKPDQIQTARS